MKKLAALILALCLLMSCALAESAIGRVNQQVHAYAGPGTGFFDTGILLSRGEYVTVLAKTWDYPNDLYWLYVEFTAYGSKYRAYVTDKSLSANTLNVPEEEVLGVVYFTADADVFAGPGWSYGMWNDTVYRGTSAVLLAVEEGYAYVECWNDRWDQPWRVWASLNDVDCSGVQLPADAASGATSKASGSAVQVFPVGETCCIAASSANARAGAGTQYGIVEYVFEGQRYTILDTAVASNGRTWYKIRVDGQECWISSGVATINGRFY